MEKRKEKILLIIGDDKLGRKFINSLEKPELFSIALYRSKDIKRLFKLLIIRKSISLFALINMIIAEILREDYKIGNFELVRTNGDIQKIIRKDEIKKVYLFRAGIIINRKILFSGTKFFNVHCAKVPEYGGLGQIYRIYKEKAYNQVASLHKVVGEIDKGEVIASRTYKLDESMSYSDCENIAYNTGIELLISHLNNIFF